MTAPDRIDGGAATQDGARPVMRASSQFRAEGRRFAAAVARIPTVPVLQVHGALDPCLLTG